jgi:hypothetical protein
MINITSGKNKVFFVREFGFAPFGFYTFNVGGSGWGEAGKCKRICGPLMLSARGGT